MAENAEGPQAAAKVSTYMSGSLDPFADDMKDMVNNSNFSDLTFGVGKSREVMYGHKVIISPRCNVLLNSQRSEESSTICLPDTSKQSFYALLEFIYTNRVLLADATHAIEVLELSTKYKLAELHQLCVEYLLVNMNVTTAADIMHAAVKQSEKELKAAALAYIEENTIKIFETSQFHLWTEETMCEVLKSDALDIDELVLIDKVGEWADMSILVIPGKTKVDFAGLAVRHIRLPLLTKEELAAVDDENEKNRLFSIDIFRAAYRTMLEQKAGPYNPQTKPRKGTKERPHHKNFQ
ncbi:BTB/POZ domain-containing protein 19-like isoform X1 [Watersipora subatra]|uniref:BTB/POZ domain-containing protein 19-like isoform X1 n=1 Tax=Watersipora subatra TaxID=2589382 RepID=UPI00355BA361